MDRDIFGLTHRVTEDQPKALSSYFVNKVANGNEKRVAQCEGEYLVELKVYRTNDIAAVDPLEAWRKALLRIKLQTREDSELWSALQRLVQKADRIFTEDPKFFKC